MDSVNDDLTPVANPSRRAFLQSAGMVAVTAPAVTLLVSVPSVAQDDFGPYDMYPTCQADGVIGPCNDLQLPD
jgi:hypothetical protein